MPARTASASAIIPTMPIGTKWAINIADAHADPPEANQLGIATTIGSNSNIPPNPYTAKAGVKQSTSAKTVHFRLRSSCGRKTMNANSGPARAGWRQADSSWAGRATGHGRDDTDELGSACLTQLAVE